MSKISRIKIKLINDINIFIIVKAYLLRKISNKLYIYIDDRIYIPTINEDIDKMISIMNNFGIHIDNVIRYSEYYNIAHIYIHRLIKLNSIQIIPEFNNPNKDMYLNDYKLFFNNYDSIKLSLICDKKTNTCYDIYDNTLYDEIFLLLLIDYSENVSYIPIDYKYNPLMNTIKNVLSDKLYFNYPEYVLSNITQLINNYQTHQLSILNIPLVNLYETDIDIIIEIIKNNKLINNYIINTTDIIENIDNNTVYLINNPININLLNNKTISINNKIINVSNNLYIDNNCNFTQEGKNVKLKYGGIIHIKNIDNMLYGKFKSSTKNKKKISTNWIPYIQPLNKTCFELEDTKQIIGLYYNFDITTKYFIKIHNHTYILNFNKNPNEYSCLVLLNNFKN